MYRMLLDFTMSIKVYGKRIGKKCPSTTESGNSSDCLILTVTNENNLNSHFAYLSINLIHLLFKL